MSDLGPREIRPEHEPGTGEAEPTLERCESGRPGPDDNQLSGNTLEAVDFLERWHGDENRVLITIDPETGTTRRHHFRPDETERMHQVIDRVQGDLNCYTPVNIVAPGGTSPTKDDVLAARALHIDADLKDLRSSAEEALALLRSFDPPPSIIVFSGGGYWPLWLLKDPYDHSNWRDRVERVCEGLHNAAGADPACRNINRLMRVPGTINCPDRTKRKAGRVPALAHVVEADWDRRWSFETDPVPRLRNPVVRVERSSALPARDTSRSGSAFRLGLAACRAGKTYEQMCAALRADPDTADWVRDKGDLHGERELKRIWEKGNRLVREPPYEVDPTAPYATALYFRDLRYDVDDQPTLHHHRGAFYEWNGSAYPELDIQQVRAEIYRFLNSSARSVKDADAGNWKKVPLKPNTNLVNNVTDALRAAVLLAPSIAAPAWLDGTAGPKPDELISCANGLLHLPQGVLLPHNPAFFTHNSLDFGFDADAPPPAAWLAFLDQLWGDDSESIETLQEIFGYCLGADTAQQKAFLLIGPKRSGKGTIARVLTKLVGEENAVAPTLASLGANFGLAPLIGKRVAIVSDARLSGRTDQAVIAERLLSITGEDGITVDRKYRDAWTGRLSTRFVVISNELPRLNDASGALASRFIVLELTESFFGREDPGLTNRLIADLPGILNWAIEGWRRLRERGHFIQPASAQEALDELQDLGSPIGAFVRDRCNVGPGKAATINSLFTEWEDWCLEQRRSYAGNKQSFGRDLRAAVPGLRTSFPRTENGGRERVYEGIALNGSDKVVDFGNDAGLPF